MNRRKLVRMILCILLIFSALIIPLTLWFSNASTESQFTSLTNYYYTNLNLIKQNIPIYAKDVLLNRTYYNLDIENPLIIELSGVPQIDSVNFRLSNIRALNYTIQIAQVPEKLVSLDDQVFAMSFKITQTCYLQNVSLFLGGAKPPLYVDFYIYNSTWNPSENRTEPNKRIYQTEYPLGSQAANAWKTISLNPLFTLNLTKTENQTFFIVLTQDNTGSTASSKDLSWGCTPDNGGNNYGPAYDNTTGTLVALDYDFSMRVSVCASADSNPELVLPSEINLKINGIYDVEDSGEGIGICNIIEDFDSPDFLTFDFDSTWFDSVNFDAIIEINGVNLLGSVLTATLYQGYNLGSILQTQERNGIFLILGAIGAVAVAGASGYRANKKRKIPINAMRNMESIIVDHNPTGGLIWSFDFISMQADIALVSGFMSAVKTFLKEMKIGGLKRLGTDFGTFIREESQLLAATCITGEIGLDEELWIRGKLHEFLIKIEQSYYKELQGWKGNVAQFRETFPMILGTIIDLDKVQKLQLKKIEKLSKNRDKMQKKVNKYGEKLEKQKAKYDSGEIDFKKYIVERYKTEAEFDKVQREYIYASLFLQRKPSPMEPKKVTPKATQEMEKIQKKFFEVRAEIEELERKEWQGIITSRDIERKEKLQRELFALIEQLGKFQEK